MKAYKPHHKKFSVAWYRRRRELHLRRYPDCDQGTRDNLDMLIHHAKMVEGRPQGGLASPSGYPSAPQEETCGQDQS